MRPNQLLLILDDILSSDEMQDFEVSTTMKKCTRLEKRMGQTLSLLYRLVHAYTPHDCEHKDWRKEAMDLWMKLDKKKRTTFAKKEELLQKFLFC